MGFCGVFNGAFRILTLNKENSAFERSVRHFPQSCVRIVLCLVSTGEGGTLHHSAASYLLSIGYEHRPLLNNFVKKEKMGSTFVLCTPEKQQTLLSEVEFALKNSTFLDHNKVAHSMELVLYVSKLKILCGLKFIDGAPDYDWSDLTNFIMDKHYWGQWMVNTAGYPGGTIKFNYLHYGLCQVPVPISVDGSVIDEAEFMDILNYVYDNRHNILIAETKAWEVINKITNPRGLYNVSNSLPASAVVQNMRREIHCATEQGTADIMNKASEAFNIIVSDRETAELIIQTFETFRDLLARASRLTAHGVAQELLQRVHEALQIALTNGRLPAYINPQVYSTMVAGVLLIAQDATVKPHFDSVDQLRALITKYVRIFTYHKNRRAAVTQPVTVGQNFMPQEVHHVDVHREPLGDSTNKNRGRGQKKRKNFEEVKPSPKGGSTGTVKHHTAAKFGNSDRPEHSGLMALHRVEAKPRTVAEDSDYLCSQADREVEPKKLIKTPSTSRTMANHYLGSQADREAELEKLLEKIKTAKKKACDLGKHNAATPATSLIFKDEAQHSEAEPSPGTTSNSRLSLASPARGSLSIAQIEDIHVLQLPPRKCKDQAGDQEGNSDVDSIKDIIAPSAASGTLLGKETTVFGPQLSIKRLGLCAGGNQLIYTSGGRSITMSSSRMECEVIAYLRNPMTPAEANFLCAAAIMPLTKIFKDHYAAPPRVQSWEVAPRINHAVPLAKELYTQDRPTAYTGFYAVSSCDEGGHYIGPEHALLLEPRQDIIAWMSMGPDVLKEIENNLPGWAVAQPLQVWYTGLPPLDTASDVWIRPAKWGKRKDRTLHRAAVAASGRGLRPSPGADLQDFMASYRYGFTATALGLKASPLRILQYISDAPDDVYTDAMRPDFVAYLQHGALMVHLVAQEGWQRSTTGGTV